MTSVPADLNRDYSTGINVPSKWLNAVNARLLDDARTGWRRWALGDLSDDVIAKITEISAQLKVTASTGLVVAIAPGYVRYADNQVVEVGNVAAGLGASVVLPDNAAGFIYIDVDGTPRASAAPPDGAIVLAEYLTSSGSIATLIDRRAWFGSAVALGDSGTVDPAAFLRGRVIDADETLAHLDLAFVDSSGGALTLTFPATPAVGNTIWIVTDANAGANPITLDGNGNDVDGGATATLDKASAIAKYYFNGTAWLSFIESAAALPDLGVSDAGKVLKVGSSGAIVAEREWQTLSANGALAAGGKYHLDTSGGALTMTLPGSPTAGDTIEVAGDFSGNSATVGGEEYTGANTRLLLRWDGTEWLANAGETPTPLKTGQTILVPLVKGLALDPSTGRGVFCFDSDRTFVVDGANNYGTKALGVNCSMDFDVGVGTTKANGDRGVFRKTAGTVSVVSLSSGAELGVPSIPSATKILSVAVSSDGTSFITYATSGTTAASVARVSAAGVYESTSLGVGFHHATSTAFGFSTVSDDSVWLWCATGSNIGLYEFSRATLNLESTTTLSNIAHGGIAVSDVRGKVYAGHGNDVIQFDMASPSTQVSLGLSSYGMEVKDLAIDAGRNLLFVATHYSIFQIDLTDNSVVSQSLNGGQYGVSIECDPINRTLLVSNSFVNSGSGSTNGNPFSTIFFSY